MTGFLIPQYFSNVNRHDCLIPTEVLVATSVAKDALVDILPGMNAGDSFLPSAA